MDFTLKSMKRTHSSSVISSNRLPNSALALFTRISTPPSSAAVASTIASTLAALVRSVAMGSARRPRASTAAAASAMSDASEPAMATSAPASARAPARYGVQPRLSAVMIAFLPVRSHSLGMLIFASPVIRGRSPPAVCVYDNSIAPSAVIRAGWFPPL